MPSILGTTHYEFSHLTLLDTVETYAVSISAAALGHTHDLTSPVQAQIDVLDGRATVLEGRATVLENRALVLESRCDVLETRATAVELRATILEARALALELRSTALELRATLIEGRCDVLEGRCDLLEGRADLLEGRCDVLEGRCDVLESRATAVELRATLLESEQLIQNADIIAVENRSTAVELRATLLESEQLIQNADIIAVENRSTAVENRASVLESQQLIQNADIIAVENRSTAVENRASVLESQQLIQNADIIAVENRSTAVENRASLLESEQLIQNTDIIAVENRSTAVENRASLLESEQLIQNTDIANNTTNINANDVDIINLTTAVNSKQPAILDDHLVISHVTGLNTNLNSRLTVATAATTYTPLSKFTDEKIELNNCTIINQSASSTSFFPGTSGMTASTLAGLYGNNTNSLSHLAISAGDNGSQGLLFSSGGQYSTQVRNIQGIDFFRNTFPSVSMQLLGGNVGIGLVPTSKLHVDGDIRTSGNIITTSGTITPTLLSYLDATSSIQTQLNSKQGNVGTGGLSISQVSGLQTALNSATTDISGLQSSKQDVITLNSININKINGLQSAINSKQNSIQNGDLTLAFTSGLQAAINAKNDVITTNSLSITDTSGLTAALNSKLESSDVSGIASNATAITALNSSKQNVLTNNSVNMNKINGLTTALNTKLESGDVSGIATNATAITALNSSKQNVLTNNSVNMNKINGLTTALNTKLESADVSGIATNASAITGLQSSKQDTITNNSLTIARTNGLQTLLNLKMEASNITGIATNATAINLKADKSDPVMDGRPEFNIMSSQNDVGEIRIGRSDQAIRYHSIKAYNTTGLQSYLEFLVHTSGSNTAQISVAKFLGTGNVELFKNLIMGGNVLTSAKIASLDTLIAAGSGGGSSALTTNIALDAWVIGSQSLLTNGLSYTFNGNPLHSSVSFTNGGNLIELNTVGHYSIDLHIESQGTNSSRTVTRCMMQMYSGSSSSLTSTKTYNVGNSSYHRGITQAPTTVEGGNVAFYISSSMVAAGCFFRVMNFLISVEVPSGQLITVVASGKLRIEHSG
jgi:hypothetical protein